MTSDLTTLRGLAELNAKVDRLLALLGQTPPPSETLTVAEVARELGRSRDWVLDQLRLRRIKRCPVGKPYRIPRSEIVRLKRA